VRYLFGKQVLETDEEVLDPRQTALVVVDMQNDFAHPDGHFARSGANVEPVIAIIPTIATIVDAARAHEVLVVWVQQTTLPDGRSDSPAWLAFKTRRGADFDTAYTLEGSWGQRLVQPLATLPADPIVKKFRSSAFTHTTLDAILRNNGIATVVACGCMTEGCLESTARDAAFHDYYVVVIEDAVASNTPSLHEASLSVMQSQFPVRRAAEIAAIWAAAAVAA
jgi:nicotinamidase-related amidase